LRRYVFTIITTILSISLYAQSDDVMVKPALTDSVDQLSISNDAINYDSTSLMAKKDSIKSFAPAVKPAPKKSDIETTINYSAKDSMIFDTEGKKLFLYGDTHLDYDVMTIESNSTTIDWDKRTLSSKYDIDSTGRKVGKPVFTQKNEVYETDDIVYNFKNKRALIKGVVTERDGAFMHGKDVKKNEDDELFITGGKYSTCNLADPHFFIQSDKIKVIPGSKIVTGPFQLKFREIPTPLWGPFGMFPQPKSQSSGIIFPSYGEEQRRGFFLRDAGYYFAFNDYVDLRLTGDIYSKGAHAINASSNYRMRYKFSGGFNLSYSNSIDFSSGAENPSERSDYSFRWSHRPETHGNSSFSSSVNIQTSTYNQNNNVINQSYDRQISSQFQSNVGYTQRFQGSPFNMAMNARHSQNVATGIANLSLPDFSWNMNRIYPFKKVITNSKSPLAKISFSHNFVAKNEFSNAQVSDKPLGSSVNVINATEKDPNFEPLELFSNLKELYPQAKIGGKHSIPLSTSFNLLKFFTVSPSVNYQEVWYLRELKYTYVDQDSIKGVRIDTLNKFSRAGSWSSGASVNTRIYGTYFFKGDGKVQAIRHVATPSVSFSYSPDFGDPKYGVWQDVQIDSLGNTQRLSKYNGFAYGSPNGSKSEIMSFSLSNNLELKVKDLKDSTQDFKKVKIFDNLAMSSGYNFAADSFKLSNISWSARTSFFKGAMSISVSGVMDPYMYELVSETTNAAGVKTITDRRLDQYTWNNGQGLGNLSSVNTSVSLRLKPKTAKKGKDEPVDAYDRSNDLSDPNRLQNPNDLTNAALQGDAEAAYIMQNPQEYVDFDLPWSMNIQYSINRNQSGFKEATLTQSSSLSGSVALTNKTQVSFRTGYDFKAKEVIMTSISVSRDLHCWSLSFNYVPFGTYQSFNLSIRPKSSLLQQLKIDKRRSFQDNFR
jgi:hypothetical protein